MEMSSGRRPLRGEPGVEDGGANEAVPQHVGGKRHLSADELERLSEVSKKVTG